MKRFICLMLLALVLTYCKDKPDPTPVPGIESIAGRWRGTEVVYQRGDSTVTESQNTDLFIRYDGVMLYDGTVSCCAVNKYVINGISFNVVPKEDTPPANFICDCMPCDELVITQTGDKMTITPCGRATSTYTRVK